MTAEGEWLSLREVANALGLSYHAVLGRVKRGELPADRQDDRYRIGRADLESYIEQARVRPGDLAHLVRRKA